MDPQQIPKSVNALVEQGRLTPDAILNTLTQRIKNFGALSSKEEQPYLRKTFDSLCTEEKENGTKHLTQSAFIGFLQNAGFLPPSMTDAGAIVYRSLLYLSKAPFYESPAQYLTYDGLLRALVWTDSERTRTVHDECQDTRSRTPADTRRLLFQSLATTYDGEELPFDADYARKQAERRAFDFSGVLSEELRREYAQTNHDEDGDEMFHDLLDALYVVSQPEQIGRGGPPRDGFRPLAKEMRGGDRKLLHHLTIPQDEIQTLVKLLLVTHFGLPGVRQFEQSADLDRVSESIVKAFAQGSTHGVTWEMFDQAIGKMPELFAGIYHLLSPLYKSSNGNDNIAHLPQPGHIATLPVLSQLGTILSGTVSFDHVQLHKSYHGLNTTTTPINATSLSEQLTNVPDPVIILLISGTLVRTGEKAIFGFHLPWSGSGSGSDEKKSPCLLFQLSPIHDVFWGSDADANYQGQEVDGDENLVFGKRDSGGVVLVLGRDLKRVTVSHDASGQSEASAYRVTAWRGDWGFDVDIEDIEVWVEL